MEENTVKKLRVIAKAKGIKPIPRRKADLIAAIKDACVAGNLRRLKNYSPSNIRIRPLLVLDLDETLVHANLDTKMVSARPHLLWFLHWCFKIFDVGIWTASVKGYAELITKWIMTKAQLKSLIFLRTRKDCTKARSAHSSYQKRLKELEHLGYPASRMLVVDDRERAWGFGCKNLVLVPEYRGDQSDKHLALLQKYLNSVKGEKDYRKLDKRKWLSQPTNKQ